jgi:hypothetical protein
MVCTNPRVVRGHHYRMVVPPVCKPQMNDFGYATLETSAYKTAMMIVISFGAFGVFVYDQVAHCRNQPISCLGS